MFFEFFWTEEQLELSQNVPLSLGLSRPLFSHLTKCLSWKANKIRWCNWMHFGKTGHYPSPSPSIMDLVCLPCPTTWSNMHFPWVSTPQSQTFLDQQPFQDLHIYPKSKWRGSVQGARKLYGCILDERPVLIRIDLHSSMITFPILWIYDEFGMIFSGSNAIVYRTTIEIPSLSLSSCLPLLLVWPINDLQLVTGEDLHVMSGQVRAASA